MNSSSDASLLLNLMGSPPPVPPSNVLVKPSTNKTSNTTPYPTTSSLTANKITNDKPNIYNNAINNNVNNNVNNAMNNNVNNNINLSSIAATATTHNHNATIKHGVKHGIKHGIKHDIKHNIKHNITYKVSPDVNNTATYHTANAASNPNATVEIPAPGMCNVDCKGFDIVGKSRNELTDEGVQGGGGGGIEGKGRGGEGNKGNGGLGVVSNGDTSSNSSSSSSESSVVGEDDVRAVVGGPCNNNVFMSNFSKNNATTKGGNSTYNATRKETPANEPPPGNAFTSPVRDKMDDAMEILIKGVEANTRDGENGGKERFVKDFGITTQRYTRPPGSVLNTPSFPPCPPTSVQSPSVGVPYVKHGPGGVGFRGKATLLTLLQGISKVGDGDVGGNGEDDGNAGKEDVEIYSVRDVGGKMGKDIEKGSMLGRKLAEYPDFLGGGEGVSYSTTSASYGERFSGVGRKGGRKGGRERSYSMSDVARGGVNGGRVSPTVWRGMGATITEGRGGVGIDEVDEADEEGMDEVDMMDWYEQPELPGFMERFRSIYNRGGRIGIYTPSERSQIISRFKEKKKRRCWKKKVRYGCRKDLADRRVRVKGRFVKREEDWVLMGEREERERLANGSGEGEKKKCNYRENVVTCLTAIVGGREVGVGVVGGRVEVATSGGVGSGMTSSISSSAASAAAAAAAAATATASATTTTAAVGGENSHDYSANNQGRKGRVGRGQNRYRRHSIAF